MPWLQIKLRSNPEQAEQYEDLLLEAGCSAITLEDNKDQPIFEPELGTTPLWPDTVITGLFVAESDLEQALDSIQTGHLQLFPTQELTPIKTEILEDKDWERAWMDNYKPIRFGTNLWICPSWCQPPVPEAVNLILDPGLAFGTGTHPTTALCLEWLEQQNLTNKQVIDYGCGSGILGLATLLLGAEHVSAVDIDPQALMASKNNLVRNKINSDRLSCFLAPAKPAKPADLLIANILAGPLLELAEDIAALVSSNGQLALSGLLAEQADDIIQAYKPWFRLHPPALKNGWLLISGQKRA